jgi:hypothetical protein
VGRRCRFAKADGDDRDRHDPDNHWATDHLPSGQCRGHRLDHYHSARWRNRLASPCRALFGYILEGALTVDYGDKGTHTYSTGEGLLEAINWPHNGMNRGTVPVRLLAVYAGANGVPDAEAVAH